MKWGILIGIGLVALLMSAIPLYLGPDSLRACDAPGAGDCRAADAIVAVSGGDTIARTDEAIRLYQQGWAPMLVFSSAAADSTGPSNALVMKRHAVENGVPESAIAIEEFSQTTAENAANTSRFLRDNAITRVIIVTSAYHQRRAGLEFGKRLGDSVTILNHPVKSDRQWDSNWWLTSQGWSLALGELIKIVVYHVTNGAAR